ncbi:hypothetical protein JXA88_02835 [Candidatus Fermentibacteria bacterium]|nr:hypothetical protein [Candidatus Fermentibacteria bacterium]
MKRILPALLAVVASCSWRSPDLPPSDLLLEGTYTFKKSDLSRVTEQLEGSWLVFSAQGALSLTNPGFDTPDYGMVDIVEEGTYAILEMAPDSGFIMMDITRQWPPAQAISYVFHGGLNRLHFQRVFAEGEEHVIIRVVPDGTTRSWATFAKRALPTIAGDYTYLSSTSQALDDLLRGATASFATADSTFELSNPVTLEIDHADTIVLVSERATYSVSLDSIRFVVIAQEPFGADSLFFLTSPSVTMGVAIEDGQMALSSQAAIRAETTYWTPPQTIGEVEPNDTPATATEVGGTGMYNVTGGVDRGGVGLEGYTGDLDYFRIVAGSDGELRADLSWQGAADLDLFAFDPQGVELARSANAGQSPPEGVSVTVTSGQELYLMIASIDNPATYTCSVKVP